MGIKYKEGYKYQIVEDYSVKVGVFPVEKITTEYLELNTAGVLTIRKGYAYDGASGGIDSKNVMRGALVHDCLYQLLRMELIHKKHKKTADELFKKMCIQDGMSKFRAWYIFKAVDWFGKSSTLSKNRKEIRIAP